MQNLEGKVAVVTGAASGIGYALAEQLAEAGMKVVLSDIQKAQLEKAVKKLQSKGADTIAVWADVSDYDSVIQLAQKTLGHFGKVHILVNNAGIVEDNMDKLWEKSLNDWKWIFNVNFYGAVHGIKAFVPIMLEQNEPAHIINTASEEGLIIVDELPIYTSTKRAIVNFTEALYLQLKDIGAPINVTMLCPGLTATNILKTVGENRPEDLPSESEANPEMEELLKKMDVSLQQGDSPQSVAEQTLEAILNDQLYCITAAKVESAIQYHADCMIRRVNPVTNADGVYCPHCGQEKGCGQGRCNRVSPAWAC